MSLSTSEEYDTKTDVNQKDGVFSISNVLSKMDKNIANYPNSAVKYIRDDMELINLDWKARADFEYFLLGYNVNRNADLAAAADVVSGMIKNRSIFKGFQGKKSFRQIVIIIAAIIFIIAAALVILTIIVIIIIVLSKASIPLKPMYQFLFYSCCLFIVMVIVIMMANSTMIKMIITDLLMK